MFIAVIKHFTLNGVSVTDASFEITDSRGLLTAEQVKLDGLNHPLNLRLQVGQVAMLTGPSGSGKSRFLKALADLLPHHGEIRLQGQLQQDINAAQWRRQVMYFAADSGWWADTVLQHFDTKPEQDSLKRLGLDHELLNRPPDLCSSGEKQRLALLRGLQKQPSVLLLDEITANLDGESTEQVETLLKEYLEQGQQQNQPRGIVWISHDMSQCQRLADEVVQLHASDTPGGE